MASRKSVARYMHMFALLNTAPLHVPDDLKTPSLARVGKGPDVGSMVAFNENEYPVNDMGATYRGRRGVCPFEDNDEDYSWCKRWRSDPDNTFRSDAPCSPSPHPTHLNPIGSAVEYTTPGLDNPLNCLPWGCQTTVHSNTARDILGITGELKPQTAKSPSVYKSSLWCKPQPYGCPT